MKAVGVRELGAAIDGRLARAGAIAAMQQATRQYAKRQRTWFRHQLPAARVTSIDPGAPDALERALYWWSSTNDGGVLA